jgi:hypothetical protein
MWRVKVAPLIIVGSLISYIDLLDPTDGWNISDKHIVTDPWNKSVSKTVP